MMVRTVWITITLWFLSASFICAKMFTIKGEVINGTTGQLSKIDEVRLIELKDGMQIRALLRNLDGRYAFTDIDLNEDAPHLIQVQYKGVHYSTPLLLDELREPIRTTVFDTTNSRKKIRIKDAYWVIVKEKGQLKIKKLFVVENLTAVPKTLAHPQETFRFYVPENIQDTPAVSATSGSMPLKVAASTIEGTSFYAISHPIKPGQTQIEIEYHVPYPGSYEFQEILPYRLEKIAWVSSPLDMNVETGLLYKKDSREDMDAALFEGGPFKKGDILSARISGGSDPNEPQIITVDNRTQNLMIPIVLALACIFSISIFYGMKSHTPMDTALEIEKLFRHLISLEEEFNLGRISIQEFDDLRNLAKSRLIGLKKQIETKPCAIA